MALHFLTIGGVARDMNPRGLFIIDFGSHARSLADVAVDLGIPASMRLLALTKNLPAGAILCGVQCCTVPDFGTTDVVRSCVPTIGALRFPPDPAKSHKAERA